MREDIGRNGFKRVGRMSSQDIYQKDGELYKEVDYDYLKPLEPSEREKFENQKMEIS